jgi:hypothetical protein
MIPVQKERDIMPRFLGKGWGTSCHDSCTKGEGHNAKILGQGERDIMPWFLYKWEGHYAKILGQRVRDIMPLFLYKSWGTSYTRFRRKGRETSCQHSEQRERDSMPRLNDNERQA